MNVADASVDRIKFIEDLLEETREIRTFFAARRNIKKEVADNTGLLGVLIGFTAGNRKREKWRQLSLERSRQIENLMGQVETTIRLAKQQEEDFEILQTILEMHLTFI